MECKPKVYLLVLTKKECVEILGWDSNEFTKLNSMWNQFAQMKKDDG